MLTPKELRFKKHWEEQREGGKIRYILLYSMVGTFMLSLIISVLLLLFYNLYPGTDAFWMVPATALLFSFIYAYVSWRVNERRWRGLGDGH